MEEGPLKSVFKHRLQTTLSSCL